MDQRSRFICRNQMDSRKLLFLLGIAFGLVMVLQFFELPYDTMLSSLLSSGKVSFAGKSFFPPSSLPSPYNSPSVSSESIDEKTDISSSSAYSLQKNDSSSFSEQNVSSSSAPAESLSMTLTPSYTVTSSPRSFNLNSIPPTVSVNHNESSAPKTALDVKQRLPQSNLSAYNQPGNSSLKGNPETPLYPISEMNKLLQHSYSFPQSSVCELPYIFYC